MAFNLAMADRSVWPRIRVEEKIARKCAFELIAAGYVIDVNDGEELVLKGSTNVTQILAVMFTTDEDGFWVYKDGELVGLVRFIYGNDGWDVINDYSVSLEHVMVDVMAYAETFDR